MTLWDWASAAYARPGVEPLCLALQDQHGQCVSYLLWALWAAGEGRPIDATTLAQIAGVAHELEVITVQPMRNLRRTLTIPDLRADIRAAELDAEKSLMELLERRSPPPLGPAIDPHAALRAAAAAWAADIPTSLLDTLADAFSIG